jgi:hypothetical protein
VSLQNNINVRKKLLILPNKLSVLMSKIFFYDFHIFIFYFKLLLAYKRVVRDYTPKNAAGMNANGSKSWCLSRLAG